MVVESLLVMRELGIQVGTRYYSGRERKLFIEREKIECVAINEGIQTWMIFYYLAIIVKGQERMVLPFEVRGLFLVHPYSALLKVSLSPRVGPCRTSFRACM